MGLLFPLRLTVLPVSLTVLSCPPPPRSRIFRIDPEEAAMAAALSAMNEGKATAVGKVAPRKERRK